MVWLRKTKTNLIIDTPEFLQLVPLPPTMLAIFLSLTDSWPPLGLVPGTSIFHGPPLGCTFILNLENYLSRDSELQELVEEIGRLEISL